MKREAIEIFKAIKTARNSIVANLVRLEESVNTGCDGSLLELADIAYALRDTRDMAEDIRKRCDALGKTAQNFACLGAVTLEHGGTIGTEYVAATPSVKTVVSIPSRKKEPEAFAKLMDHLKVPRELWERGEHAAMQPHWPGLMELVSERQANGLPMPPGIDPNKTYAEYSLRMRGRKEIDAQ